MRWLFSYLSLLFVEFRNNQVDWVTAKSASKFLNSSATIVQWQNITIENVVRTPKE